MISVDQAWKLIAENLFSPEVENCFLPDASGRILAEDVISPYDHPFFDNSAVDGYAIRFADIVTAEGGLKITGKIPAGTTGVPLESGSASRIFTGAPLPEGADTVIMQEFVSVTDNLILLNDPGLKQGSNVRKRGEQLISGQVILKKGTIISPPLVGFLATIGIGMLPVFRMPAVHIIVTGDELLPSGSELTPGKIFESNGPMLRAAFKSIGISASAEVVADNPKEIALAIKSATQRNQLIVLTGGVSVGDHDFTRESLETNAFSVCFHSVSQKPGKPLLFARNANVFAFGLPGNPRAGIMAFYLYILQWLHLSLGCPAPGLKKILLPLASDYFKKGQRAEFISCRIEDGKIHLGQKQDSHMLSSFGEAQAIAWIPESVSKVMAGEILQVFILPL